MKKIRYLFIVFLFGCAAESVEPVQLKIAPPVSGIDWSKKVMVVYGGGNFAGETFLAVNTDEDSVKTYNPDVIGLPPNYKNLTVLGPFETSFFSHGNNSRLEMQIENGDFYHYSITSELVEDEFEFDWHVKVYVLEDSSVVYYESYNDIVRGNMFSFSLSYKYN